MNFITVLFGHQKHTKIIRCKLQRYFEWREIKNIQIYENIEESMLKELLDLDSEQYCVMIIEVEQEKVKECVLEKSEYINLNIMNGNWKKNIDDQNMVYQFVININYDLLVEEIIYISRHGKSEFNKEDRIGGDSELTLEGIEYGKELNKQIGIEIGNRKCVLMTSYLKRAISTAELIQLEYCELKQFRELKEIDAGICEGLTYSELEQQHLNISQERDKDKLRYRYPQGESYIDIINRLIPVVLLIEQYLKYNIPVIIIGHQANLRCLLGYFQNQTLPLIPHLHLPLHSLFKLQSDHSNSIFNTISLPIPINRTNNNNNIQ